MLPRTTSTSILYVPSTPETSKLPIAPMGKLLTCSRRLTLAQLRPTHRPTTESTCRRDLQCFPSPRWETHVSLLICTMGDSRFAPYLQGGGVAVYGGSVSIVNSQIYSNIATYVRTHLQKIPSGPMGRSLTCLPRLSLAQLRTLPSSTGSTCRRDLQKFPTPMGKWLTCLL